MAAVDPRYSRSLNESIDSEGGFVVPSQFTNEIFNVSLESEVVRPRAKIYSMKSKSRTVPATVIGDHSSNFYGGALAYWKAEATELETSEPTFREIDLTARKLTILAKGSAEWFRDSTSPDVLQEVFTSTVGFKLDQAFISGSGAGEPLGIMNADCTIEVSAEDGQDSGSITYQNLCDMYARLYEKSYNKAIWVCHPTCIPQLLTLSLPVGTGGSHYPALKESGGAFSLLTRPVIFTEKAQPLGTKGDLMLVDLSNYIIGMRQEIEIVSSIHVAFTTDQIYTRGILRADGKPAWNEALTLADGVTTVSPFLILAARE